MKTTETFPLIDHIIKYEDGSITGEDALKLFQYLVDTGLAWTLQGHYGRMATAMIEEGLITPTA